MNGFWTQDRLKISLVITGITIILLLAVILVVHIAKRHEVIGRTADRFRKPLSFRVFKYTRIGLAATGGITFLSPLIIYITPLKSNPDLGMGIIALMIAWPILLAQIAFYCIPFEAKMGKEPIIMWLFLAITGLITISFDKMLLTAIVG